MSCKSHWSWPEPPPFLTTVHQLPITLGGAGGCNAAGRWQAIKKEPLLHPGVRIVLLDWNLNSVLRRMQRTAEDIQPVLTCAPRCLETL